MARQVHERRRIEKLLAGRERQGLSFRELSEQSGVPAPTLAWWSAKVRRERGRASQRFVEVVPAAGVEASGDERAEIVLRSGRQLVVREGIDEQTLQRLVAALEAPC